jgi:hypothetical protein
LNTFVFKRLSTAAIAIVSGRNLYLDGDTPDPLNFGIEFDEGLDRLSSSSFDDSSLTDRMRVILASMLTSPNDDAVSIGVLRSPTSRQTHRLASVKSHRPSRRLTRLRRSCPIFVT